MVAVPEKARLTVTGCPETADRVAVRVATPSASDMGLPLRLKLTVGGRSSSIIVPVPVAVVIVALVGFERLTVNVSFGSSRVSPFTWTVMVLVVSPALKIRVAVGLELQWAGAVAVPSGVG